MIGAIIFCIGVIVSVLLIRAYQKTKNPPEQSALTHEQVEIILKSKVSFYDSLKPEDQASFLDRVNIFLQRIKITPVKGAYITDEDKVLVASAGIIPLFYYKNWFYNNLNEVLLYPESFNKDFALSGANRDVVGMVGNGAMHRTMILSLPYLRQGFNNDSKSNTAIHEFVHLLDKSDGAIDGIPEAILKDDNIRPWIKTMHEYIKKLRKKSTDIDLYAATNETEFFAVVSEYFFQQPEKLKEKHPELYALLDDAFDNKQ